MTDPSTLRTLNKRLALAAIVALAMIVISIFFKPPWRDEFWSLYFSDPALPLSTLITERMRLEVHPPLSYIALYAVRTMGANVTMVRFEQLALVLASLLLLARARRFSGETVLYALALFGGFWTIYYTVEIRPYVLDLVFVIGAVAAAEGVVERRNLAWNLPILLLLAAAGAFTDYFTALWMGLLGGFTGLVLLSQRRWVLGVGLIVGVALAMAPTALWIQYSLPVLATGVESRSGALDGLVSGLLQGNRALLKTLASNLALTVAAVLGARTLARQHRDVDVLLLATVAAFIVAALPLNSLWSPILKERTFIVLIPPLTLLGVRAVLAAPDSPWLRRLLVLAPIMAAITPLLFSSEYLKDREKLGDVREALSAAGPCADQPILTLYPHSPQPGFGVSFTASALAGAARPGAGSPRLVDVAALNGAPPPSTCRIKALVLGLTRGEKDDHRRARETLKAAGLPLSDLEEVKLGGGRNRLFVAR
jgi:hypothetical protein